MNQPPTASISSRRAVRLCAWLLLCVAVVFGSSQARASLTRPTFQTPQVIALSFAPQVPSEPRFKLEITTGILCGNDPVNRHDPLGLLSEAQVESLVKAASRGRKGLHGERLLERLLRRNGRTILYGPLTSGKNVYEKGADIIAYNQNGKIEFWDNKFLTLRENASRAPTLTVFQSRQENIAKARALVSRSNNSATSDMLEALNSNKIEWIVGGEGIGNNVKGITQSLRDKKVIFGSDSWIRKSGILRRGAAAVVTVGTLVAIDGYAMELQAAQSEDAFFEELSTDLESDGYSPSYALCHASVLEASGGVAGQEIGGNVGSLLGGVLGGLLGIETGPGAILTGVGGSIVGGGIGDEVGKRSGISLMEWLLR